MTPKSDEDDTRSDRRIDYDAVHWRVAGLKACRALTWVRQFMTIGYRDSPRTALELVRTGKTVRAQLSAGREPSANQRDAPVRIPTGRESGRVTGPPTVGQPAEPPFTLGG